MAIVRLIVVGAGGLGREVREYARDVFDPTGYEFAGFLDDQPPAPGTPEHERAQPILGPIREHRPASDERFLMAIGDPSARAALVAHLQRHGAVFETLVHPKAHVSSNATIGLGSLVAPFASIGAAAQIGRFAHLHFYASAAHDTVIGDYTSLSPYSVANGQAVIGVGGFLGTRATVNPTKRVGAYAKVTAGSVVYQDVPDHAIAFGNPAKARKQMDANPSVMDSTVNSPGDASV